MAKALVEIDLDLADAALRTFERNKERLAFEVRALTVNELQSTTQRDLTLAYVRRLGLDLTDMKGGTIEAALKQDNVPEDAKAILENRLQASATSPAKYRVLQRATSADGRLRNVLQFCGAIRTGRWCLAEGSRVLVRDALGAVYEKAIETVQIDDEVWDGDEWVAHEGVVFSGDKPVIEHDGVIATAAHNVYVSTSEHVTLAEAKAKGLRLWRGNSTLFTN